ncbi:DNA transposition protein [Ancylobacter lacus]|uniref:DNA transposition protein n=1 Tax=Ancylobacter lacus TaxID=2579970 RepID=UPI001BD080D1|nr:DNA transposition protein [Ancylobacter lacus]MBS7539740.1 DNA transposition protein [Ancylobacter lacus]
MSPRRDTHTLDLFAWEPPTVVERFAEPSVRAASWRDRVARAVRETLDATKMPRDAVAEEMSAWLGEDVPRAMLDAYASLAKSEHTISFLRVIALGVVTGDPRLLQLAAETLGRAVIESRYVGAIEEAMAVEAIEQMERVRRQGRRRWKGGGR